MEKKIETIITLYGQHSRWGVVNRKKISPTLTASMGMGGGLIPMVIRNAEKNSKNRSSINTR